jgi:tetratricopeptide (TPR) repeat protein
VFHGCRSRRVLVALALWMVAPSMLLAEELSSPSAVLRDALARRDRARGLKKAGDRQANRGRMAQALVSYREALSLDPQYVAAHRARAELLLQLQREGEALRCYRMALRDNPKSVELWRGYAFVLRRLGQYDEAMAAYRRCRQLAPDDPSLLYGIALAHRAMGDVPAAIGAFNTFLLKETRVSQRAWVAEARANVLALGGRPVQSPLLGSPDGHGGTKPEMPNNGGAKPGALMRHVPIPRPKAPRAELRGADALRAQGDALARHANCADALIRYGQAVKRDAFNLRASWPLQRALALVRLIANR